MLFDGWMPGGPYWTYRSNEFLVLALTLLPLSAHLVGGFVSGGMALSSPGMNGALSAVLSGIVAVIKGLYALLSDLVPSADALTRSENLGFLFFLAGLFALYFPFTIVAGYLGGRLGGRLRPATRS